jgi:uncharacterized protein (UPF0262 family)
MPPDIIKVDLEDQHIRQYHPLVRQERDAALGDLLIANTFAPASGLRPPLALKLSIIDNRLVFHVTSVMDIREESFRLSVAGFKTLVKDYFQICSSYYQLIEQGVSAARLEAVDQGRRGIHNEGAEQLIESLKNKVEVDHNTARRLFTLICVLHLRDQSDVET